MVIPTNHHRHQKSHAAVIFLDYIRIDVHDILHVLFQIGSFVIKIPIGLRNPLSKESQAQYICERTGINSHPETAMQMEVVLCAFAVQGFGVMDYPVFNCFGLVRGLCFDVYLLLQISEIVEWKYDHLMAGVNIHVGPKSGFVFVFLNPISTITINQPDSKSVNGTCMLQQVNQISNLPPDRVQLSCITEPRRLQTNGNLVYPVPRKVIESATSRIFRIPDDPSPPLRRIKGESGLRIMVMVLGELHSHPFPIFVLVLVVVFMFWGDVDFQMRFAVYHP